MERAQAWGVAATSTGPRDAARVSVFFFFIFKKIKISKIYVCFEKFRKWPPVARPRDDRVLSPK